MRRVMMAALLALIPAGAEAAVTFSFHGSTDPFSSYVRTFDGTSHYSYDAAGGSVAFDATITIDTASTGANHAASANALDYDGEGSPFLTATFTSAGTTPILLNAGDFYHALQSDPDNGSFTLQIGWQAGNGDQSSFIVTGTSVPTADFGGVLLPDLSKATDLYLTVSSQSGTPDRYVERYASGALAAAGAVPEPASWALMIVGFGTVGGAMRRRKTAAIA